MSQKCAQSGCGFHLPDNYPLPFCPWHAAPGKGLVKVVGAVGLCALGVGGFYAFGKVRDAIRKRAEQEVLERNAEETAEVKEPQMDNDGFHSAACSNGNGFDPYKILGVGRSASVDEIEAAYRERALKHHPDRGGDGWAFEQVHAAYQQIRPSISRRAASAGAVVVATRERPALRVLRPKPAVPAAHPPVADVPKATRKAKSAVLAALLAFLFGPLGMLYSDARGAIVLFAIDFVLLLPTFGLILFVTWPVGIAWAVVAANSNST
ncbi:MAG TPA: DnaJ domain-containing protein [Pirellulales bacterium]|nr:DnaJ domain-containing protein [Pirellulales bacterium]